MQNTKIQIFTKLQSFKSALAILLMAMVALVASCDTDSTDDPADFNGDW